MVKCPNCSSEFESNLGHHWLADGNTCSFPEFSERQEEIVTGILLGDGCVNRSGNLPCFKIDQKNSRFLEWIDNEMDVLTTGVKERNTTGFSEGTIYSLESRSLPCLEEYASWYSSGEKLFPEKSLSSLEAKVWYCCDGSFDRQQKRRSRVRFCSVNENGRLQSLANQFFDELEVTPRITENEIYFSGEETRDVLEWMGGPLPGFEYKWP